MRSPSTLNQAPDFSTAPHSLPRSTRSPSWLMPSPYRMSNSTSRNGGAILFFTTLTRVRLPTTLSPSFSAPDPADVQPAAGVELQGVAAGGGLGVAEHDADLHPDLVDEDDQGVGLGDGAGQLAQRLAHQPGLQADVGVAHLALQLGLGGQRGDRVDHDDVHRAGAHQHLGDLQRLLAAVGLRHQQVVGAHAQLAGVADVQGVLGVDEGADAARPLGLAHHVQGQGGLARGLRPVDLDDAAAGQAAARRGRCPGPAIRWGPPSPRAGPCPRRGA